jgi:hypothetical protein
VKPGATLKVVAKGPELGHSLGAEPASVWAILTLGERRYCMRFGGTTTFKEGKKLLAKDAAAPASCDPTGGVP